MNLRKVVGGNAVVPRDGEELLRQAEACLSQGLFDQGMDLARTALQVAGADRLLAYRAYMLLYQLARRSQDHGKALAYVLGARITALEARLWDLEFKATLDFIELRRELGERMAEYLDEVLELFAQQGVDVLRYLPEWALRPEEHVVGAEDGAQ